MSQAYRVLRITFTSREDLECEYLANLVNGGLFIPGQFDLLYGEPVIVLVDLPFVPGAIELEGCVVQSIPMEFEKNGGRAGVALEIQDPLESIRQSLEKQLGKGWQEDSDVATEYRVAPRSVAEVRARVCMDGVAPLVGRTRNLSLAGVLVAIVADHPPVGAGVNVAIVHPTSGEERFIPGVVVRHELDSNGKACAIGVQFLVADEEARQTIAYLGRVKASEHARRLGGISGSISTLGVSDLVTSFGLCVPSGRFTLMRGGEIGTIAIHQGVICSVQIGAAFGIKALVRMLSWEDGNFEFHAMTQAPSDDSEWSMPIEMALLEAARFLDEGRRDRQAWLPREASLRIQNREVDLDDPAFSKIERSILDRVGVGVRIGDLIESIQEPDSLIEDCISRLIERGAIDLEDRGASI